MKRIGFLFSMVSIIICLCVTGCVTNKKEYVGLHIAGMGGSSLFSSNLNTGRGFMKRDIYVYGYPGRFEIWFLVAVDDRGEMIKDPNIRWWTSDDHLPEELRLGKLVEAPPDCQENIYVREFKPNRTGSVTVYASDGVNTDSAQVIVYDCKGIDFRPFSFDDNEFVFDPTLADIQKTGTTELKIYRPWVKINDFPSLGSLHAIRGDEAELQTETTIGTRWMTFLIRSRNGNLYGVMINGDYFAWKRIDSVPSSP